MRILPSACLLFVVLAGLASDERHLVHAKKPTRPSISTSTSARRPPTSSGSRNSKSNTRPSKATPTRRKRPDQEEEEDDNDNDGDESFRFPGEEEDDDDIDDAIADDDDDPELDEPPRRSPIKKRPQSAARGAPPPRSGLPPRGGLPTRGGPPQSRKVPTRRSEEVDDDNDDDYYERPKARRGGPPPSRGRVVPYANQPPGAFTRGLTALREAIPDPGAVRDAALSSISAARETSSKLTANLYREVKGLTSSELEQVMLKATRPDDSPVKGKHVERLVGVTYQISGRYDIYDAVLRKLWGKMAERDWRTTIKALYILHRFSADGAPEHQPALKARLRELRRTRDPKRKDKYFNSKQLLAGDSTVRDIVLFPLTSLVCKYLVTLCPYPCLNHIS
jgi:ANTH domain